MKMTIRAARVNAGLTQAETEKATGISKRSICAYESGKRSPKLKTLSRLCEVYGCGIDDIKILP